MYCKSGLTGRLGAVGFTLIELLVVVLIIGILAAIALPQYKKAVQRGRNAKLKTLARSIQTAQKAYFLANGRYAANFNELALDLPLTATDMGSQTTENICGLRIGGSDAVRRGEDFQVVLHSIDFNTKIAVIGQYTSGRYKCMGFNYGYAPTGLLAPDCGYYVSSGQASNSYPQYVDEFCSKIEKATLRSAPNTADVDKRYSMN